MTRSIGGLVVISWALYLLCFYPFRAESITVAMALMILCAMAGAASGILAMRNSNRWRLVLGTATMILLVMYVLAWIRAATMLGDAAPDSGAWTLFLKVFKTKIGLIEYLWRTESPLAAIQQAYWEVMAILQLCIWLVVSWMHSNRHPGSHNSTSPAG